MRRAFNYGHYRSHRIYKTKIEKPDLYTLLDNENVLRESLNAKKIKDDIDLKKTEAFLNRVFKVKGD